MTNIEDKIEQYFLENIKTLRNLNKLLVSDVSSNRHILSDKIYDLIDPLMSNYTSLSILTKMLNEYVYNLSISKTEKEYFINKIDVHLTNISDQPYIDIPDCVDKKSLIYFEEEVQNSIRGFLLGFITKQNIPDKKFRSECIKTIKEEPEVMNILFIKHNISKFSVDHQKEASSKIKKYLRRKISIKLVYPIINLHQFLMLTSKKDFERRISREATLEKLDSDIIEVCARILERDHKGKKEDEINDYVTDLLRAKNYDVTDQTRSGVSTSKLNSGEIDLMVRDERKLPITIIECLKLSRVSPKGKNGNLVNHITKLLDNYDGLGLSNKYLFIYSFAEDFEKLKQNYSFFLSFFRKKGNTKSLKIDSIGYLKNPYGKDVSNLVYIPTFHRINGVYQKINHYLINLKK